MLWTQDLIYPPKRHSAALFKKEDTMGFIDDLMNAIDSYETDNCATEIIDFSITGGGGTVLNVNETFQFKVRVRNQSHIDMKNVKVQAIGTKYADVALLAGAFSGNAISGAFNLDAHQIYTTGFFRGRAKAVTEVPKDIVTISKLPFSGRPQMPIR